MRFFFSILILLISLSINAQSVTDSLARVNQKNIIYTGIGYAGLAGQANISYERQILCYENAMLNARLAYGGFAEWGAQGHLVLLNWAYLVGKKKNYFEFDLGLMSRIENFDVSYSMYSKKIFANYDFWPLLNVGYRYYNPKKHFMLRTGVGTEYIYFSLGVSF
jgi:hypothetical protein